MVDEFSFDGKLVRTGQSAHDCMRNEKHPKKSMGRAKKAQQNRKKLWKVSQALLPPKDLAHDVFFTKSGPLTKLTSPLASP